MSYEIALIEKETPSMPLISPQDFLYVLNVIKREPDQDAILALVNGVCGTQYETLVFHKIKPEILIQVAVGILRNRIEDLQFDLKAKEDVITQLRMKPPPDDEVKRLKRQRDEIGQKYEALKIRHTEDVNAYESLKVRRMEDVNAVRVEGLQTLRPLMSQLNIPPRVQEELEEWHRKQSMVVANKFITP